MKITHNFYSPKKNGVQARAYTPSILYHDSVIFYNTTD